MIKILQCVIYASLTLLLQAISESRAQLFATVESLYEDFDRQVSPSTAESGRESLHERLESCYLASERLTANLAESQTRLQNLKGQQESFYKLDEEIQKQLHDIESQVSCTSYIM